MSRSLSSSMHKVKNACIFGKSAVTTGKVKAKFSCLIQWFEWGRMAHWCYRSTRVSVT